MPQRAGLTMTRIDSGRDGVQMGILKMPALFAPFDSRGYVQEYFDDYLGSDVSVDSPPLSGDGQQQQGGGIVDKINKGIGSAIGLPNGVVTDSVDSFKKT